MRRSFEGETCCLDSASFKLLAVGGLKIFVTTVSRSPASAFDFVTRKFAAGVDVETLAPYFSANTKIYLRGTKEFAIYPTPNVVIAPDTEKDIQKIVSVSAHVYACK